MFLPDINIWLSLIFEVHAHHNIVQSWFDEAEDNCCVMCRMTQQGLLRLSTNPSLFGKESITMAKAWEVYDKLLHDPRIFFMNEPEGLESLWRIYTLHLTYSPKAWNDAYLAAFAKCMGLMVVTLDKGFKQYTDLKCLLLRD
ncbi:MAG: PIN domain-containing protein [Spirochaetales bacterium]|nr:PIN domain-containing protein [Spirochaetales bacterium]